MDRRVWVAALLLAGCAAQPPAPPAPQAAQAASGLSALPGWSSAQLSPALPVFLRGCARLALTPPDQKLGGGAAAAGHGGQAGDWLATCAAAKTVPPGDEAAARQFFATRFDVVQLTDPKQPDGLFTGYYEPEVAGSREQTRLYRYPVLAKPADLAVQVDADGMRHFGRFENGQIVPYYSRAEIDHGALRRQRLDLLYLKSPIDLFFLQVQGAGRVDLPNGQVVRVGYAGNNGQPYVPIGRVLAERGEIAQDQISAQTIRAWLQSHPREAASVMELNPSYIFFRELPELDPQSGPPGALGVALTPMRSIAIDPQKVPLAAPVWIDTANVNGSPLRGLMIAQDSGSAIKGGLRADIFYGWGTLAEDQAGRMQAPGRAWLLLPKAAPAS